MPLFIPVASSPLAARHAERGGIAHVARRRSCIRAEGGQASGRRPDAQAASARYFARLSFPAREMDEECLARDGRAVEDDHHLRARQVRDIHRDVLIAHLADSHAVDRREGMADHEGATLPITNDDRLDGAMGMFVPASPATALARPMVAASSSGCTGSAAVSRRRATPGGVATAAGRVWARSCAVSSRIAKERRSGRALGRDHARRRCGPRSIDGRDNKTGRIAARCGTPGFMAGVDARYDTCPSGARATGAPVAVTQTTPYPSRSR